MKYNMASIMRQAWRFFRKMGGSFAKALRIAWANAKAVRAAAAGTAEESHTWSGWKAKGYEVIHESKAVFKVAVIDPTTKTGTRILSYFVSSQVQPA